jgi:hypothetical protein
LDQLVACHRRMMEDITSKALFGYRDVRPAIDKIIGTILRFQGVVNSFETLVGLAARSLLQLPALQDDTSTIARSSCRASTVELLAQ